MKCMNKTLLSYYVYFASQWRTAVALFEFLFYKSEGRWFDPSWCLEFFIGLSPIRTRTLGSTQTLTRHEYQDCILRLKAAGA
jgi:hypothetical protein